MPASIFRSVVLPAPLWPMMPMRSPSAAEREKSERAWIVIAGLSDWRNSPLTTYSFSVTFWLCRTVKAIDAFVTSIFGISACSALQQSRPLSRNAAGLPRDGR